MSGKTLRFAALGCLVTLLLGCGPTINLIRFSESSSSSTEHIAATKPNLPSCYAPELRLTYPVVVKALGISRYGRTAGVESTPAHMLGAAIFHQPLKAAAWRTQQMMRNERTFGGTESPVFTGPSEKSSMRSIAISRDDKLVAAALSTTDGSVVFVWNRRGQTLHQFSRENDITALRFVGDDLLVLQGKDNALRLTMFDGTERASFPHAAEIRTLEVDRQGTILLTVTSDDVVHLWPIDSTRLPASFQLPAKSCFDAKDFRRAAVRFDDSGKRVLVSRCDGVWVYDNLQSSASVARIPIVPGSAIASLEISSDGTNTAAVTADGALLLGKVSDIGSIAEKSTSHIGRVPYARNARPMFSSDGRKVAVKAQNGAYDVWKLDAMQSPTTIFVDRRVNMLQFSGNGKSLIGASESRVFGWNLEASQSAGRVYFAQAMTLVSPMLAADGRASAPTAFAIDGSGSTALVGLENGGLLSFGLETTPAIESRFRVNFDADIYVPQSPSMAQAYSDPTYAALTSIGGIDTLEDRMLFTRRGQRKSDDDAPTMTRQKVTNLRSMFFDAEQTHKYNGSVMLILYISAHGWIGADGNPVVLPGDADKSDPTSWIPYQWFVSEVDKFVGNDKTKRAIIIFDTCQSLTTTGPMDVVRPRSSSPYVTIVESASPGQYAWHWRVASEFSSERTVESESRFGFPYLPPKAPRGRTEATLSTTMSVFPLASTCILSGVADEFRARRDDPFAPKAINVGEWLAATSREADGILIDIPDMKKKNLRQEITRTGGAENDNVRLFGFKY